MTFRTNFCRLYVYPIWAMDNFFFFLSDKSTIRSIFIKEQIRERDLASLLFFESYVEDNSHFVYCLWNIIISNKQL